MTESSFPVTVEVRRPDGTTERVRVGTAVKADDGFVLRLGELSIGSTADAPRAAPAYRASAPSAGGGDAGGVVFPPYGRAKGQPVVGASTQDLEFYAGGCRRSLGDPAKSRWHDKERALLAVIEAELARQAGGGGSVGGGGGGRSSAPRDEDGPPPMTDDDIPF